MFSDPQFWVAVAFVAFIAAIFNPVRKILTSNLDAQIKDIRNKIDEAGNLKNETQTTLSEIKKRQNDVQIEIQDQIHGITKLIISKVGSFDVSDNEIKNAISDYERSVN